jgi:hypothetical protein
MQIRALPNGARYNLPQWSPSVGTGGRHLSEQVVAIDRNGWSPSAGAGRHSSALLVQLNGHFEGAAMGETFNHRGQDRHPH